MNDRLNAIEAKLVELDARLAKLEAIVPEEVIKPKHETKKHVAGHK
jgi:hypothetical protein